MILIGEINIQVQTTAFTYVQNHQPLWIAGGIGHTSPDFNTQYSIRFIA